MELLGDRDLLLRARRGDEGAARALWDSLAPRMIAYAAILTGPADAEDITQTVLTRALRASRRDIARIDDLAAWALRATRNESLNTTRSRARRQAREGAVAAARVPEIHPHDADSPGGFAPDEALRAAFAALPPEQHEAVWLHHCAGLTFDQLAIALDLPRSTAASRYRAGIRRLREALCDTRQKEPSHG
jgi:RNA polymerase sigma-70 factor (ECF subfamily)